MARAKGKAAPKPRTTPKGAPAGPAEAIPVEDTTPASSDGTPPSTQPANKKQKIVRGQNAEKTTTAMEAAQPGKTSAQAEKKVKREYDRGTAILKKYWADIESSLPKDTDIDALKLALSNIRKVAVSQLKQKGSFTLHGLCTIRVMHMQGRDAGKVQLFGQEVDVKARKPCKRLQAKSTRCLKESVCKETNK